jgi:SRSO17 transposase
MVEAERVGEELAELLGRLGRHFARVEPFTQAGKYVRGLLSDLPRKNCWTLAEYAGDTTPDRMQRLLERACWDTMAAMGTVRDFVAQHLDGGRLAVLVLDESVMRRPAPRPVGSSGSTSAARARSPTRSTW